MALLDDFLLETVFYLKSFEGLDAVVGDEAGELGFEMLGRQLEVVGLVFPESDAEGYFKGGLHLRQSRARRSGFDYYTNK